jgi:uncharacterized protein YvpB
MIQLEVPYRSQRDWDAAKYPADCGPTCVAMVLNYRNVQITPDEVYNDIPRQNVGYGGITFPGDLANAIRHHNVQTERQSYYDKSDALKNLRSQLDAGNPFIALVHYNESWYPVTGEWYVGGHYVVVTGYDEANITIHDPLIKKWTRAAPHVKMSNDLFCKGWGECYLDWNRNWSCITVLGGTPPSPHPIVQPVAQPSTADGILADIPRRIRALAAYRRTAPPDFNNPAAVQFWQVHLGDWGLNYDEHLVKRGDTLSGLSKRYYGDAGRWFAIREYNGLNRDGFIMIDQTILIPRVGTTGNQAALPADTADFGKDLDLEDLVDPDLPAEDYSVFAEAFRGIDPVEPSA